MLKIVCSSDMMGWDQKVCLILRIQGNSSVLIQTPVKTKRKKNKVLIYVSGAPIQCFKEDYLLQFQNIYIFWFLSIHNQIKGENRMCLLLCGKQQNSKQQ